MRQRTTTPTLMAVLLALSSPAWATTDAAAESKTPKADSQETATKTDAKADPKVSDYLLMKVNNEDITAAELQKAWESQFPQGQAPSMDDMKPEMRDRILRGLMTQHLILTEVDKSGIEKTDAVQKQLAEVKKMVLIKAFLAQKSADAISESDIKSAYEEAVSNMRDQKEIHARHILVASEKEAKEVKKEITGGKSFEEVAKEKSKDPGSASNGGDLGYFTKDKMVKEFADAAFALKKGEISDPVKSPFGWHIIKVEDSRKVTPPTLNEAKDSIRAKLQDKKLNDYVRGLVKKADVKVYDEKGKEVKFAKEAPEESAKKK